MWGLLVVVLVFFISSQLLGAFEHVNFTVGCHLVCLDKPHAIFMQRKDHTGNPIARPATLYFPKALSRNVVANTAAILT
jgi:hypothetical protein